MVYVEDVASVSECIYVARGGGGGGLGRSSGGVAHLLHPW